MYNKRKTFDKIGAFRLFVHFGSNGFIVHAKRHIVNHMQDWIALLRGHIADIINTVWGTSLRPSQIDCPAGGEAFLPGGDGAPLLVAARSAAPLRYGADAREWAVALSRRAAEFPPGGTLLQEIHARGGHLLFVLNDSVFTQAAADTLNSLPAALPGMLWPENAPLARALYAKRRMWMQARKAQGLPFCPPYPAAQQGLLLSLALAEYPERTQVPGRPLGRRALELRMLEAADSLLAMAYEVPPRARGALQYETAHVADAAARLLALGLARIEHLQS